MAELYGEQPQRSIHEERIYGIQRMVEETPGHAKPVDEDLESEDEDEDYMYPEYGSAPHKLVDERDLLEPRSDTQQTRTLRPRPARRDRTSDDESDDHDGKNILPSDYKEKRKALKPLTWERFIEEFVFTYPKKTRNPSYATEIVNVSDERKRKLKEDYTLMAQAWFSYYSRPHGRTRTRDKQRQPLARSNLILRRTDEEQWDLFVGLSSEQRREIFSGDEIPDMTYKHYDTLIDWFLAQTPETIANIKRYRNEKRLAYLQGQRHRELICGQVIWMVHRDFELPWMVHVDYHWHNSKAVHPLKGTDSEMLLCGKLKYANQRLYHEFPDFNKILPAARQIENNTFPLDVDKQIFEDWDLGSSFAWYNTCYDLMCIPTLQVGYGLFLCFKKDLIRKNTEKIVVPNQSNVIVAAGEIRPLDLRVGDSYAFDLNEIRVDQELKIKTTTNLVFTNFMGYPNRPGVGNDAFMANSTCDNPNNTPFFKTSWTQVGHNHTNIITNTNFATKHHVIRTKRDIKGQDVLDWDKKIEKKWVEVFPFERPDYYMFPVEFEYDDSRQKKYAFQKKQERLEKQQRENGQTNIVRCSCMSYCLFQRPEHSTIMDLFRETTDIDDANTGNVEHLRELLEGDNGEIYEAYLDQFPGILD
jgi:hypothetical protein